MIEQKIKVLFEGLKGKKKLIDYQNDVYIVQNRATIVLYFL